MSTIGKGAPSRQTAGVFDEAGVVDARTRTSPGSQDIQMYDVVELAEHFGVSRLAALYRLRNLGLLTEPELAELKRQEEAGQGRQLAQLLELPEPDHEAARNEFSHRFLGLALEASDEKRRFCREVNERLGSGRLVTTPGLFVLAIRGRHDRRRGRSGQGGPREAPIPHVLPFLS